MGEGRPPVEALPFVSRVTGGGGGGGGRRDGVQAAGKSEGHVGRCDWWMVAWPAVNTPHQLCVFYLPAVVAHAAGPILGRGISAGRVHVGQY